MNRREKGGLIPAELPILAELSLEYGSVEPVAARSQTDPYKGPMAQERWLASITALKTAIPEKVRLRFILLARGIREGLLWTDEIMDLDRYCAATCGTCHDPCCNANGIYYDRGDLLYLMGLDADLPFSQTRERAGEPCQYLSPEGCILPRMCRPFICTWYLCEVQMEVLHQEKIRFQREFSAVLQLVRRCRLQLVDLHASWSGPKDVA